MSPTFHVMTWHIAYSSYINKKKLRTQSHKGTWLTGRATERPDHKPRTQDSWLADCKTASGYSHRCRCFLLDSLLWPRGLIKSFLLFWKNTACCYTLTVIRKNAYFMTYYNVSTRTRVFKWNILPYTYQELNTQHPILTLPDSWTLILTLIGAMGG
jgi:hypothetical protein